jgi:hypothetical protein
VRAVAFSISEPRRKSIPSCVIDRIEPIGFWSYSRQDDEHSGGRLSQLRARLSSELQINYGRDRVQIFQDSAAIPYGADWDGVIRDALNRSTFFIPILTPNFIQSEFCLTEVEIFLEREKALHEAFPELAGHRRIFPILYIPIAGKEARQPELVSELEQVQWLSFERLRHQDYDQPAVRQTVSEFAATICELLDRRVDAPASSTKRAAKAKSPAPAAVLEEHAAALLTPEYAELTVAEPDRQARINHGLAVAGVAALMAMVVWALTLSDKVDDRLQSAAMVLVTAVAAFAGSFFARRLFDFGRSGQPLRRTVLHVLLAGALAIPAWIALFIAFALAGTLIFGGDEWYLVMVALGTVAGVLAGFLIALANLVTIYGLRRLPEYQVLIGAGGLALAAAAVLLFGVVLKSEAQQQEELLALMAVKGELSGLNEDGTAPSRASIVAAQKRLGLPETGTLDDDLVAALEALPDRTEWTVGAGDDLGDIINRAQFTGSRGGNREQTIQIAPGTYRLEAMNPDFSFYLSEARIILRGMAAREDTVLMIPTDGSPLTIDDDTIENLTFRQESGSESMIITTTGPYAFLENGDAAQATIRNVVVDARTTAQAVTIGGGSHESVLIENATIRNANGVALGISGFPYDPSEAQDGKTTALPKAVVRNSTLSGKQSAIVVSSQAVPVIEDNVIGPIGEGNGIYVVDTAGGIYSRNRINRTGNYAALAAGGSAKPEFDGNIINDGSECVNIGEKANVILRANRFTGCFGGTAADEANLRLSGNAGLVEGDITVTGKARVTTE